MQCIDCYYLMFSVEFILRALLLVGLSTSNIVGRRVGARRFGWKCSHCAIRQSHRYSKRSSMPVFISIKAP